MDYIIDSEVPRPCRHFCGRNTQIDDLPTQLESNDKVFLYGIAGIVKSETAKAYARKYRKHYTNILYVEYSGDLRQSVIDMDNSKNYLLFLENVFTYIWKNISITKE